MNTNLFTAWRRCGAQTTLLADALVLIALLAFTPDATAGHIYFSDFTAGTINRVNLDGSGRIALIGGLSSPAGPSLDLVHGHIYWGESSGNIRRANLDGNGLVTLLSGRNGPGMPVLDLASERMYWHETGSGEIRRANFDGSGQQVLVSGQNSPRTVALDLAGGKMYWSEWGAGRIRRANLDGTGLETVISGLSDPNFICLDLAGGRMFWCNQGGGNVSRANLDGSNVAVLISNLNGPIGMAIDLDNGHMYVANSGGGDIRRANLDGTEQQIFLAALSRPAIVKLDLDSGPPFIHVQPQGKTVALGSPATLKAAIAGAKPLFLQWYLNDAPLTNATNATLQFPSASTSDMGEYRLAVSNTLGVATSAAARLVVASSPVILAEPVSRTIIETNNVTFTVSAIGAAPLGFQWRFNGTNLDGATTTNLSLVNVQTNQAGEYTAVVSNSYGATTGMVATLTVLVRPRIVQQPQSQTILEGGTVTFTASASGTLPLGFRWMRSGVTFSNGIIVNTATASALTLTNVGMSNNAATFRLTATNEAGTVSSTNARLSVLADFDRDGISDEWEARYGLNTNELADALLDADGDSSPNRDEYVAGTDPTDAASVLRIRPVVSPGGGLHLQFFAISNRAYSVLFAPDLSTGLWEKMTDVGTQPSNRLESVSEPLAPARQRFYRVVTPQWP